MRLTWLNRLAASVRSPWLLGALCYAVFVPGFVLAQPSPSGGAGAPAPVAIEVEDDVEVVATPAPGAATAPAVTNPTEPPPTAAPAAPAATVAPAQPTAAAPAAGPEVKALSERVAALEARLAEEAAKKAEPPAAPAPVVPTGRGLNGVDPWLGLNWSGFVQAQYESNQLSENQVLPDGTSRNHKRFLVRRARLRMQRQWTYAGLDIEFDANTVRAPELNMRRLAASVYWPAEDPSVWPYLRGQAGLLDIPFGHELPAGIRERLFSERSVASLAFFPSEADIGATVDGGYGPLRYAFSVMNGVEADGAYRLRDPNSGKDLLLRVGFDTGVSPELRFSGGVSFLEGTGFHRGANATKNTLQWNDINEDGSKSDAEVSGVPGRAADPSEDFSRWGVAIDARAGWHNGLGWAWLYGEASLGQNLDRALFVADPIASSLDSRELGYYVALTQEITPYFVVGFRTDFYDGNSDFIERRRGRSFKQAQTVRTYTPVVGVALPGLARLSFEYNIVRDTLGRDQRGEPADLKNNRWVISLQVGL